jgi:hypothetical protein
VVTDVNGTMNVSMPDLDAAGITYDTTLTPFRRDAFFIAIGDMPAEITFVRDASGVYRWIRSVQLFVAERTP